MSDHPQHTTTEIMRFPTKAAADAYVAEAEAAGAEA